MLATVDLHDEPCFFTKEIDDVVAQRHFTAKLPAHEALRAKVVPETTLGIAHV